MLCLKEGISFLEFVEKGTYLLEFFHFSGQSFDVIEVGATLLEDV